MDAYPSDYVTHNYPLIVLSGLATDRKDEWRASSDSLLLGKGIKVASEIKPVTGNQAEQLLQDFLAADASDGAWNNRQSKEKGAPPIFRIKAVGREYVLPPRKADPPLVSPDLSPPGSPELDPQQKWVLHSPVSPLSPSSSTFPDGVMAPDWIAKHQYHIPSVLISFFAFTSDLQHDSIHDNQLKTEINAIKESLTKSEYKTRYVVVLLSDTPILQAPEIEERLSIIRKATGLDPKSSLFFLPPNSSRVEITSFVHSILTTLQPSCIEYYRDLTKHARRKKARGHIPPPTAPPTRGTSQTLSSQGWGVRYDFKLGVFAEFRQEMDAASRHFGIALDTLLGPDGVFEATASWSPRWDETRLLADTIALRVIRCLLWNNLPSSAVQSWVNYREKMRDLVDRKGKGSTNYGWHAWESRWAKVMAELIQKAELPVFQMNELVRGIDSLPEENPVYAPPEKAIPVGERLAPWLLLHHPGYWLRVAVNHAISRRQLAEDMPEEDRMPPGMSPATQVASRYGHYDTYLVPEPHNESPLPGGKGFDHCSQIVQLLNEGVGAFYSRGQQRAVDKFQLDMGKELMQAGRFAEAANVLRPLWESMSWRTEGWWDLVSDVTWALRDCAQRTLDMEMLVATEWELMHRSLRSRAGYSHKFLQCLDPLPITGAPEDAKLKVVLSAEEVMSFLSVSLTFAASEGHVGEPLDVQLTLSSNAQRDSRPVVLSKLGVRFQGSLGDIRLTHEPSSQTSLLTELSLVESIPSAKTGAKPNWTGRADLTVAAGQTRVYAFSVIFREAGEVDAVGTLVEIEAERFVFVYTSPISNNIRFPVWWLKGQKGLKSKRLPKEEGPSIKVLPKPPKMEISIPNLRSQYYTGEPVIVDLEVANEEEEDAEAVIELRFLGRSREALEFEWLPGSAIFSPVDSGDKDSADIGLPGHLVGRLSPGGRSTQSISFTAPDDPSAYALEAKVLYHLLSDRDTPISKTLAVDLAFTDPFEANYDFTPRVHRDPWPCFFSVDESQVAEGTDGAATKIATGIAQTWLLTARVASFADETLLVEDMGLILDVVDGGAKCTISKEFPSDQESEILPQDLQERKFCLDIRKLTIDDRRPAALDLTLEVVWRRKEADWRLSDSNTSRIPVRRLLVPSGEPRVLASAYPSSTKVPVIHLIYTLENPTMHFLTFELTMEGSEEFASSGPKYRTLHVLPLSRQMVQYNLLPLVKGVWITPLLRVVDRYFNKTLKVQATDGMKSDKKGVMIWVDVDEDSS